MVKRFDVHSTHGGANNDDDDVPATAVDKMVNQLGTKHHGITKKLKQGFTRSEAHRRALATTTQPRRIPGGVKRQGWFG